MAEVWTYSGQYEWRRYPTGGTSGVGWGVVPALIATRDPWTPLDGTGSQWIARNRSVTGLSVTAERYTGMARYLDSADTAMPGLLEGRARTMFQMQGASGSGRNQVGLVCLASEAETQISGTAYGFLLDGLQAASTWERLMLVRFPGPNGLLDELTVLATSALTLPQSTALMLELRWELDASGATLDLAGLVGEEVDGSDVAQALEWHQTGLPTAAVTTQGPVVRMDAFSLTDGYMDLRLAATHIEGSP